MNPAQPPDELLKLAEDVKDKLMEHCDSVIILMTMRDEAEKETGSLIVNGGNFYASLGQVREWLVVQDQRQRNHESKESD